MATKKSAKKTARKKAGTPLERVIDAALDEALASGWRQVSMEAVASRAGMSLGDVLLEVPNKARLLVKFIDQIDERTIRPGKAAPEESSRDRLFEILMRRFDAMNERREEAKAVISGVARDPATAFVGLCRLKKSFVMMLEAAGVNTSGPCGCLRVAGLKAVSAAALRAWMTDDTADLSKTMAALDRALDRAEKLAGLARWRGRKGEETEAA